MSADGFAGYRGVDIDGERVLVGSPGRDELGSSAGAAYVFDRVGATWSLTATLFASDGGSDDIFGRTALSGDTAAVAAPSRTFPFQRDGGVYVFELQGSTWVEVVKLTKTGNYAQSLDLDGDVLVVSGAGAAHVYERVGGVWSETATLVGADAGASFGTSVTVSGDRIAVSDSAHTHGGATNGAVYVFERQGASWVETAELQAQMAGGPMGAEIDLDGAVLAAGAPFANDLTGLDTGSVFVFELAGATWSPGVRLFPGVPAPTQAFGAVVAVDGTRRQLLAGTTLSGQAWYFQDTGGGWAEVMTLDSTLKVPTDRFGHAVALDGGTLLVGAPAADDVIPSGGTLSVWTDGSGDFPSFEAVPGSISLAPGGSQTLGLNGCIGQGLDLYLVVGSFAGASPGFPALGFWIPLNPDPWLVYTMLNPGSLFYPDSSGNLDAAGEATATFFLPPGLASLVGLRVDHAFGALDKVTGALVFVSNAAGCDLVP
jgi:hypothetical protein